MLKILYISELIVSIILTVAILLQNKGTGLSATFGGDFSGFHTKRGLEKFLMTSTIILGFLFIALSLIILILNAKIY